MKRSGTIVVAQSRVSREATLMEKIKKLLELEQLIKNQESKIKAAPGYWQEEFSDLLTGSNLAYNAATELKRTRMSLEEKLKGFQRFQHLRNKMDKQVSVGPNLEDRKKLV